MDPDDGVPLPAGGGGGGSSGGGSSASGGSDGGGIMVSNPPERDMDCQLILSSTGHGLLINIVPSYLT